MRPAPLTIPAFWGCSLQGRVCSAMMEGNSPPTSPPLSTGTVRWRNAPKTPLKQEWVEPNTGQRMALYYHFIGSERDSEKSAGRNRF